jgi:hypothetical protein
MKTILTIAITFVLTLTASGQSRDSEREITRAKVKAEIQKAWSLASDELLMTVLIETKSNEYKLLFLRGLGHLPKEFQSREFYPITSQAGAPRVQYLGIRQLKGFRFAVFRRIEETSARHDTRRRQP